MNRLTRNSLITDLPMPIKLQESCGEDACMEACEQYVDNNCNECPIQECMSKLSRYEDLEEQGLLVKLSCKVGDTVYVSAKTIATFDKIDYAEAEVISIRITKKQIFVKLRIFCMDFEQNPYGCSNYPLTSFGKTVFLTEKEIKKALEAPNGE